MKEYAVEDAVPLIRQRRALAAVWGEIEAGKFPLIQVRGDDAEPRAFFVLSGMRDYPEIDVDLDVLKALLRAAICGCRQKLDDQLRALGVEL